VRPTDLQHVQVPEDPTLSPDGQHALVTVTRSERLYRQRSEIWRIPTDGSAPPQPITDGPRDTNPLYSPDGRLVACLRQDRGHPQIVVMDPDGGHPRQVTEDQFAVGDLTWHPDSKRLLYTARVRERSRPYDALRSQVFSISVDDPRDDHGPLQLTRAPRDHRSLAVSPDGGLVAYVSPAPPDGKRIDPVADLLVMPAEGGDPVRVTTDTSRAIVDGPAFSPDGRTLWFRGTQGPEWAAQPAALWRAQLGEGAAPERLTDLERWDTAAKRTSPRPLLVDAASVTTTVLDRGTVPLLRFPSDGGEPAVVLGGERTVRGYASAAGVTVAVVETATSPGEVVAVRDGQQAVVLTEFGRPLAEAVGPAGLRPLRELPGGTAPDGYPVHGWVIMPDGDGPHPVVLDIHGGPFAQDGHSFSAQKQVLAAAGFAVVQGNPRGSAGYGQRHGQIFRRAITRPLKDLTALLDAALADPELQLDKERVGVLGSSYGGTVAGRWIGETDRFAAAVSDRAVYDLPLMLETAPQGPSFVLGWRIGPDKANMKFESPTFVARRINTPLLMIVAEGDQNNPPEQALHMREAITRDDRNVPAEVLRHFPGEGHALARSGQLSYRVERLEAILGWFQRYL